MIKRFFPSEYARSIFEVDYAGLRKNGVRGLFFDIDNTVESYDTAEPSPQKAEFIKGLAAQGFSICFISNNNEQRVKLFNSRLGFHAVFKAKKPGRGAVVRAAEFMGVPLEQTAIIGDQIFTDVWCGNRCGIHTVLVTPVSGREEWTVKLKRFPERLILWRYKKYVKKHD